MAISGALSLLIERDIVSLAQTMATCGISLEDAVKELRDAYIEELNRIIEDVRNKEFKS